MTNPIASGGKTPSRVDACLSLCSLDGICNDHNSNDAGEFYYNGGHFEAQSGTLNVFSGSAVFHANQLGNDNNIMLATELNGYLAPDSLPDHQWIVFNWPVLAEGIYTEPGQYADFFLRRIVANSLQIATLLGQNVVCTDTWHTVPGTTNRVCPSALYEPPSLCESGEMWHYSAGHWIEDDPDPAHGNDGAFNSLGSHGFYPWIWKIRPGDNYGGLTTPLYGLVARNDNDSDSPPPPAQCQPPDGATAADDNTSWKSVLCGRAIRKAFLTGNPQ